MAQTYPENKIYGGLVSSSNKLGESLRPFRATKTSAPSYSSSSYPSGSRKSVDINKYQGIMGLMKSLGTETVDYGGSTKFEKFHPGVDIANKIGTEIPAFTPGKVVEEELGHKQGDPGYGNYIVIQDPSGAKHKYSHLSQALVKVGDVVSRGQIISRMGNTGQTYSVSGGTGSHLDYRILDAYNKYVDPLVYLSKYV